MTQKRTAAGAEREQRRKDAYKQTVNGRYQQAMAILRYRLKTRGAS